MRSKWKKIFSFGGSPSDNTIRPFQAWSLHSSSGHHIIVGGGGGGGGGFRGNGGQSYLCAEGDGENFGQSSSTELGIIILLRKLADAYNKALVNAPNITKILTSAFVSGLGDILIQLIAMKRSGSGSVDWRRFFVFASCGGLYIAPVIGFWFNWLNSWPLPEGTTKTMLMLLADQTVGTFAVLSGFYFAFELAQRAIPPYSVHDLSVIDAGVDAWRKNLWKSMKANYYCWPLINYINFTFVPLNYRVLFSNFAAVFWNMYLSNVAHS